MGIKNWVGAIFGKGDGIIKSIGDVADRFIQTKEEKAEFQLALRQAEMDFKKLAMEAEEMYMKDRQSAREMYMKDSSLQKVFAIVFLVGYIALSVAMVIIVFGFFKMGAAADLEPFQASLISMVFTAMSTKINTITDFLFGGSKGQDNSEKRIAESFAKGTK
jgi:hypothetical protein